VHFKIQRTSRDSKLPYRDVSHENSVPVQLRTFRVEVLHPFTEQSTYDTRSPTRKRTVNDESGSAHTSEAVSAGRRCRLAIRRANGKAEGNIFVSCIKSPFQKCSTEHAYVFETALSGSFSRRIWRLSADGRNWTHTGVAEDALRHIHCRALRPPCRDVSRGGYGSYPRTGGIGHMRAIRKALYDIRAVTFSKPPCRDASRGGYGVYP